MLKSISKIALPFVFGVLIGAVPTHYYWSNLVRNMETANINFTVMSLNCLHEDSSVTNAVKLLESRLTSSIETFYSFPPKTLQATNALRIAKNYYNKYPYLKKEPGSEAIIKQVFTNYVSAP